MRAFYLHPASPGSFTGGSCAQPVALRLCCVQPHPILHVPPPPPAGTLRDVWALVLFLVDVGVVFAFAIFYGLPFLGVYERRVEGDGTSFSDQEVRAAKNLLYVSLGLALLGNVLAILWLHVMLRNAGRLILLMLWSTVMVSFVLIVFCSLLGVMNASVIFAIFTLMGLCLLYEERHRVDRSSANLRLACRAILDHMSVVGVAYLVCLKQLVWAVVWTVAALGVYAKMLRDPGSDGSRGANAAIAIFMIASLYWGQQVIEGVLRCTIVGTVSSWWYTPEVQKPVRPRP
jgi:hypothetical protein